MNLYEYVRGNPVRLVDPDGRESSDDSSSDRSETLRQSAEMFGKLLFDTPSDLPVEERDIFNVSQLRDEDFSGIVGLYGVLPEAHVESLRTLAKESTHRFRDQMGYIDTRDIERSAAMWIGGFKELSTDDSVKYFQEKYGFSEEGAANYATGKAVPASDVIDMLDLEDLEEQVIAIHTHRTRGSSVPSLQDLENAAGDFQPRGMAHVDDEGGADLDFQTRGLGELGSVAS